MLVPDPRIEICVASDWADGMGASLRAGLVHATGDAVLITLVDLPGTPGTVVDRLLTSPAETRKDGDVSDALRQASYDARPGHPVLVGANHWQPLIDSLHGDRGARPYLVAHGVVEVECGDLHHGRDEDT